ncbi:hypothetical protein [Candidatus Bandiella numerosa]|uniref:hypothetical protein n=1 Tax=Candidatus Bandiella numerosa TaxID=2570586 RepID=UPI001F3466B0|nr:hypothetical protein [Candidatus Bandiella numerosa]
MNNPQFQADLFQLEKKQQTALLSTLKKIHKMTWEEVYSNRGLKWEIILSKQYNGKRIYSFRFSQKYRGLALREDEYIRLLTLHVDHDSAYL